jgi:RNA polymerase sigma-70 factor (ECF subfamily)
MPLGQPCLSQPSSSTSEPAERELICRLRAGDAAAFDALVLRYWSLVVAYATRIVDGSDLSEDIAQETFLRVWEHRGRWSPAQSLRPLLYRIARNLALNERRRRQVRARSADTASLAIPSAGPTPIEAAEGSELRHRAEMAIESLSPRRREVFVLARFHHLSFREISEVMGISSQTVANQMSAALDRLQAELRPFLEDADGDGSFVRARAGRKRRTKIEGGEAAALAQA